MKIKEIVICVDENSMYFKAQGEIIEIRDIEDKYNIGIRLGPAHSSLLGYRLPGESDIIYFQEGQLKQDEDWSCENKAKKLFGETWHHFYQLTKKLDPQKNCTYKGCKEKNTERIMVNIWGCVSEFDVCDNHKEFHGKCMDVFPQD